MALRLMSTKPTDYKVAKYPENIHSEVSSLVMFFFNSTEGDTGTQNASNANYTNWSGAFKGEVPQKNQAWAAQRNLPGELNKISDATISKANNDITKAASVLEKGQTTSFTQMAGGTASQAINNTVGAAARFGAQFERKYKRTTNAVELLTPDTLRYDYGAGWSDVNFSPNALGLLLNVAANENTLAGSIIKREVSDKGYDILGEGGDIGGAINKSVINPYTQQSFHGMNRRTFQFSWQLSPKNMSELNQIQEIISLFKFHMHPSIMPTADGLGANYLNYPGQVDVEWYFKPEAQGDFTENPWLPRITTCVVEAVSTDMAPNGHYSFFKGVGAPTQINFSIQLKEIHPLQKSDISLGS